MIDELKVYNRALNAAEVQASMKVKGLNIAETDAVSYTHLDVYKRQVYDWASRDCKPFRCKSDCKT